ncbi:MAG: hypothetical protein U0529_10895 [Thermoanaerobaculia bacterium]
MSGGTEPRDAARAGTALAVAALTLGWLWLSDCLTVVAVGYAELDDGLFVRQALHVAGGAWLGPYDERTLAKGSGYPLFLGLCVLLRLSVPLAQRLLYSLSSLVAARAVAPLFPGRRTFVAVYAALLFQPVAWRNLTREAIYPALSLLVVGLALALLLRPAAAPRKVLLGSVLLGLALAAFWITREEGVWIVPSLLLAAGALAGTWLARFGRTRELGVRLAALGAAPAAFGVVLLAHLAANRVAYGVFTRVETVSAPFTRAYGALSRIHAGEPRAFVPVSRAAREAAYAVSPAVRELRADLEGPFGAQFESFGCRELPGTCGEIAGGWFQWALRTAAARAGHHASAVRARDFYDRLAREVNAGCEDGRIACGPRRATLTPVDLAPALGWIFRNPGTVLSAAFETLDGLQWNLGERWSEGSAEQLALFSEVASSRLAPPAGRSEVSVRGWAFAGAGVPVEPGLESAGRPVQDARWERLPSPDVAAFRGDPAMGEARFVLRGDCDEPCALVLRRGGEVVSRTPLPASGSFQPDVPDGVAAWVDESVRTRDASASRPTARIDAFQRTIWLGLARLFRRALPPATALAAVAALGALALAVRRRASAPAATATIVVAGAAIARVVLVTAVHRTSFPALGLGYLSPAYSLAVLFVAVALLAAADGLRRRRAGGS